MKQSKYKNLYSKMYLKKKPLHLNKYEMVQINRATFSKPEIR